jgi:predicted DNA-binding protein
MEKMLVSLTERQISFIEKEAKKLGISKSEYIRRVLDSYIDELAKSYVSRQVEGEFSEKDPF